MRRGAAALLAAASAAAASLVFASSPPWEMVRDLDGDGVQERVVLDAAQSWTLRVYQGATLRSVAVPGRWRPWKLALADADGDGRLDIAVGVHKGTRYFPQPHNCLFLYRWSGKRLEPLWLGSSLSRPFEDFCFAEGRPGEPWPLFALERDRTGRLSVARYRWNGFGYTLLDRKGSWKSARLLAADEDGLLLAAGHRRLRLRSPDPAEPQTRRPQP